MTPRFPHRAADDFQRALEGRAEVEGRVGRTDVGPLLEVVDTLQREAEVIPRADFARDLRSRLMAVAVEELVPAPPVLRTVDRGRRTAPTPRPRPVRLGTAVAALGLVAGTAGVAAASERSLPGDALYPVKRGIEDVRTALQSGDAGTGRSLLAEAAARLDEARQLQRRTADPLLVAAAVDDFRTAADDGATHLFRAYADGGDRSDVRDVRAFVGEHMNEVDDLATATGDRGVDDRLLEAADTLASLDQQARELCASCSPARPLQVPLALAATSGAATVNALLARPVSQAVADQVQDAAAARAAQEQAALRRQLSSSARNAQEAADALPGGTTGSGSGGTGATSTTPTTVTSTLAPGGALVPAVTGGAATAVTGLVRGVTGTVRQVTTTKTPLDATVGTLTGSVDGVADGIDTTLGGR